MRVLARWLVVVLIGSTLAFVSPAYGDQPDAASVEYVHPVKAEIIESFRAPLTPYGPGHRGIKYATTPGTEVGAAAPGEVIFAGQVAGSLHVTLRHPDGRLSSYSYLSEVEVRLGQKVTTGQTVGITHDVLHVGIREGGQYIDPESLFGAAVLRVVLIPENQPGGALWGAAEEAVALAVATMLDNSGFGLGSLWSLAWSAAGGLANAVYLTVPAVLALVEHFGPWIFEALLEPVSSALMTGIVTALVIGLGPDLYAFLEEHSPVHHLANVYRSTIDWWALRRECTPDSTEPEVPPERRVAVLVDGFTSTSDSNTIAKLPLENLGYDLPDVVRFSYEGGRTANLSPSNASSVASELLSIPVNDYDSVASSVQLAEKGVLLAQLLSDVAALTPQEVPLDIYAHSQGGVVLRLALAELELTPEGQQTLSQLGLVTTIDSPHQGADVAALAAMLSGNALTGAVAPLVGGAQLDPTSSTNINQLASASDFMKELAEHELPIGPQYLALATTADLTVTASHARLDGATNVIIDAGYLNPHSSVIEHPRTEREIGLALAQLAPSCVAFLSFLKNLVVQTGVEVGLSSVVTGAAIVARPFTLAESTTRGVLALT